MSVASDSLVPWLTVSAGLVFLIWGGLLVWKRYSKTFVRRELKLMESWDRFRKEGLVLRYPRIYKTIFVFPTSILVLGAMLMEIGYIGTPIPFALASLLWAALLATYFYEFHREKVWVSQFELRGPSAWPRRVSVNWNEVDEISYVPRFESYVVKTRSGAINVRAKFQGIGFFLKMASENLPSEKVCPITYWLNKKVMAEILTKEEFTRGSLAVKETCDGG